MANVFPTIQSPSYPLNEVYTDHTIRMQVENETILTRPRFTKMPKAFKVSWDKLPVSDYNQLRAFFLAMKGGASSFIWKYPKDPGNDFSEKEFTVRFNDSELNFQAVELNYWSGTITLQVV